MQGVQELPPINDIFMARPMARRLRREGRTNDDLVDGLPIKTLFSYYLMLRSNNSDALSDHYALL